MRYDYKCTSCESVFEQTHGMKEDPIIKCPKCNHICKRMISQHVEMWVRGGGIVKDKGGAYRDMHLHALQKRDPYARLRAPGEKDALVDRLKRAGKKKAANKKIVNGKVYVKCNCNGSNPKCACKGSGYVLSVSH